MYVSLVLKKLYLSHLVVLVDRQPHLLLARPGLVLLVHEVYIFLPPSLLPLVDITNLSLLWFGFES
jgi:hypothetical protein